MVKPMYREKGPFVGPFAAIGGEIAKGMAASRKDPMVALGGFLTAAEAASQQLRRNPADMQARQDYNFAVARIISTISDAKLDPWNQALRVPASGGDFILTKRPNPNPLWNPALYNFTPADQFDIKGSYQWLR